MATDTAPRDLKELLEKDTFEGLPPVESFKTLAADAKKILGYEIAAEEISVARFEKILAGLEITPFTVESVEKYKEAKAKAELRRVVGEKVASAPKFLRPFVWVKARKETRTGWISTQIDAYQGDVPAEALRMAIAIKKRARGVNFHIEHLQIGTPMEIWRAENGDPLPDDYDPFLVVEYRDRFYTIAVWDEPGFTSKTS